MGRGDQPFTILIADDDEDDRLLARDALAEVPQRCDLRFVEDGEKLLDYLYRRGEYADPARSPRPGLILLDLNMPRKDGREALREIKRDPQFQQIPIVIFTTSKAEEDVIRGYELGVNSFVTKPVIFSSLVETMRTLTRYWCEMVEPPPWPGE